MFRRRSQFRDEPTAEPVEGAAPDALPGEHWLASRGAVRAELSADVIGSFPGFADFAGLIVDATVVLTDRYLLVDEGEPHGFGIAVTRLDRARVDDAEVRVGFRQDGDRRSFLLRVRRSRRSPRPKVAAIGLLAALHSVNVAGEFPPPEASQNVALSWDDASAVEHERVRWTGRVTAPILVGQECTPSDVWVSLESLLWTSPRSKGVNRLGLGGVVSIGRAEIAGNEPTPALYVTIDDDAGGMIDLPFIFNLGDSFDRNNRDRTEFQSRIRGERLPESTPPARLQPWLSGEDEGIAAETDESHPPGSTDSEVAGDAPVEAPAEATDDDGRPRPESPATDAPSQTPEDDQVFANWPTHEVNRGPLSTGARRLSGDRPGGINARRWRHTRGVDGAVVPEVDHEEPVVGAPLVRDDRDVVLAEWAGAEPSQAYAAWPDVDVAIDEQPVEPPPPTPVATLAYERAALATIDAVLFVISRRVEGNSAPPLTMVPPSSVDQAAALSELVELIAAGVMTPEEARNEKARLVAVGEASVRLRTLLELSAAGHLSLTELLKKRDSILRGIDYPVPGSGASGPDDGPLTPNPFPRGEGERRR